MSIDKFPKKGRSGSGRISSGLGKPRGSRKADASANAPAGEANTVPFIGQTGSHINPGVPFRTHPSQAYGS